MVSTKPIMHFGPPPSLLSRLTISQYRPLQQAQATQTLLPRSRLLQNRPSPVLHRAFTTSPSTDPAQTTRNRPASNPDRGPTSTEDTQTDFAALNVLANTASPTTSVDICLDDGFMLDSGLRVQDGDGVLLVGGAGFLWRPWMASLRGDVHAQRAGGERRKAVVMGLDIRGKARLGKRTGGVINNRGQFEVAEVGWGLLRAAWPRPDLIIIGTGAHIRPLSPSTRQAIQALGLRIEVLDTRNAASQFNLLATERGPMEVCAALVPIGFGV